MTEPIANLTAILKEAGYSVTKPRLMLFTLLGNQEPLSMNELAKQTAGKMDRASVYRCVELFERLGIARRINIGWKYKIELSDTFAGHHHHLTCLNCQKVIPINMAALERFIDSVSAQNGFQPTEHQVEVQGYCRACTNSSASATPV